MELEALRSGNDTGNTLWINQENMYIVDEQQVQNIYNKVNGLQANSFEGMTIIDPALDVGDKIIINGKAVIYQGGLDFQGRFIANIKSKIALKQKQETTVKQVSQKVINRRVESNINQIEGKITQLVEENTETSNKLTLHEQTIDSMKDTLKSQETKIETVETKANTAQSTANTANTTANSAKSTADSNTKKIETTTTKLTEVEKTVDGITQSVSSVEEKVETVENTANTAKTTANSAKTTANTAKATADTAKATADNVNNNLTTNYYTKTETNSQIQQKADSITSTVSTQISTAKTEAINSANTSTDNKLKKYSTTSQMQSTIKQTADSINLEVSKKVGNNEIISKINQSAETVGIDATKISLNASDILNLLAGNTINLTSKNIVISADKFSVDKNGKVTCSDMNITSGKISLQDGTHNNANLAVKSSSNNKIKTVVTPRRYLYR